MEPKGNLIRREIDKSFQSTLMRVCRKPNFVRNSAFIIFDDLQSILISSKQVIRRSRGLLRYNFITIKSMLNATSDMAGRQVEDSPKESTRAQSDPRYDISI